MPDRPRIYSALLAIALLDTGCGPQSRHAGPSVQGDWTIRQQLARELAKDESSDSFTRLLTLLHDPHPDVSYAAAESIERRGEGKRTKDLLQAIGTLPRERRWPAYRALKNYSSDEVLQLLVPALEEELRVSRSASSFDERNCYYIALSVENAMARVLPPEKVARAPKDSSIQAFDHFLAEVKAAVGK